MPKEKINQLVQAIGFLFEILKEEVAVGNRGGGLEEPEEKEKVKYGKHKIGNGKGKGKGPRKFKMICNDCKEDFVWEGESTLDAVCRACGSVHVQCKRRPKLY